MGPLLHFAGRPGFRAGDATQANGGTRPEIPSASRMAEEASMNQASQAEGTERTHSAADRAVRWAQRLFVRLGVLPFLLVLALVVFTALSKNFLTTDNLVNVVRQSVYLTIVALGQMLALLTGGFDLSVGTIVALTSVVGATAMAGIATAAPDNLSLAIALGCLAGIAAGTLVGVTNGIGVAVFNVSPFMMTLGIASVGFGIALYMTGGMPVYGMPPQFGQIFGFGRLAGIPVPVFGAVIIIALTWVLVNRTPLGRYFYAVGGNIKAAHLSGISTGRTLFLTYTLCGFLSAVCGMLLTARLETGEANIGHSLPLESIAACVIGGVSLRGGVGRVGNVVLGALFIGLVQNGMNLARIESYLQTVVLGALLIFAVIVDQLRLRMMASMRD
jgi:ribose/xylose/arabinose/galactoside ABC-type transport system permease subunit